MFTFIVALSSFLPALHCQLAGPVMLQGKTPTRVGAGPSSGAPALPGGYQGGTDDCNNPHVFAGTGSVVCIPFTTGTTGTQGQNESLCFQFGTSGIDDDVWFDWTADASGVATLTTCGATAVDTKVAVWPFSPGRPADGTALACNDDACGLQTSVIWPVTCGTTYTIQVGTFPGATGGSGCFDVFISNSGLCPCAPGTALCFGVGCPCANDDPSAGCACCGTAVGARLCAAGLPSISNDTLVLTMTQGSPAPSAFFLQGDTLLGTPPIFGDGLRCITPNWLLYVVVPSATGCSSTDSSCGTLAGVFLPITQLTNFTINAGDTKYYQAFYFDPFPTPPCAAGLNASNAYEVTWTP